MEKFAGYLDELAVTADVNVPVTSAVAIVASAIAAAHRVGRAARRQLQSDWSR